MPTSFSNSPYFLCHYGVKGRSGKAGAGLWYKNGQLTEEGYRHYYMEKYGHEPSKQEVQNRSGLDSKKTGSGNTKQSSNKKALKIGAAVAATAAAAAVGFIAYKKATKLRDVMRSDASKKANDAFWAKFMAKSEARWQIDEAKLARHELKSSLKKPDDYERRRLNMVAKRSLDSAKNNIRIASRAGADEKKYSNIAKNLTRREAVKTHIKDKINAKKDEKKRIANAIEERLRNNRIRKYG